MVAMDRRSFIHTSGKSAAAAAIAASLATRLQAQQAATPPNTKIRHSVCRWCYKNTSLDDLCKIGKEIGLQSVELLTPDEVRTVQKYGLTCAILTFPVGTTQDGRKVGTISDAFNRPENHDALVATYEPYLKQAAELGIKQVICFSGNRNGMDDATGIKHCATGIRRLIPTAEKLGVKLVMELLNSKVNHHDYMCDRTPWGVQLCKEVDSPFFGLLYDIYHMQIMEGDVISTIRSAKNHIFHYHTGGVPGRHEIDSSQELNYPAIMKAIADTGYDGFVGQEFVPSRPDQLGSLREALQICSV